MPSGFGEVTRWPPRTLWSAPRTASRPAPWLSSSWRPSPPTSRTPSRRCSVETYSSPRRRASPSASSRTRFARGSRDSEPPWIRARLPRIAGELAAERGQVDAEPAKRLGGDAVVGLDERGEEVLGVEDGRFQALRGALGGGDRLLGLLGVAIELASWVSGSGQFGFAVAGDQLCGSVRVSCVARGSGWSSASRNVAGGLRLSSSSFGGRTTRVRA